MKNIENTVSVFEDEFFSNFLPLTYFRPSFNLRTGIFSLRDKIFQSYKNVKYSISCRDFLVDYMKYRNQSLNVNSITTKNVLFINGRVLANNDLKNIIPLNGKEEVFISDGIVVAIRAKNKRAIELAKKLNGKIPKNLINDLPKKEINIKLINYLWDLIELCGDEIKNDKRFLSQFSIATKKIHKSVVLLNKKNISIGKNSEINPMVVIDATNGPVVIGEDVLIYPNSTIIGPVFIGSNSIIKTGAKIYQNTSIGTMCKVGGEIEGTIFQGYSNKQHDGFLGHSYIGAWVNLGANTITSDLKNNYGKIKIFNGKKFIETGKNFLGSLIGDHVNTAINTSLNTGSVIGVSSNIFGNKMPQKFTSSFSWGLEGEKYNLEKAISVAKKVMMRREIELTNLGEKLFRDIYNLTENEKK